MLLLKCMQSFEFIFIMHLMIFFFLSITHALSQALQRSHQDIVNVMKLVKNVQTKVSMDGILCSMKFHCFVNIMKLSSKMDDTYQTIKKSKRNFKKFFKLHYFQVQFFYQVIDR